MSNQNRTYIFPLMGIVALLGAFLMAFTLVKPAAAQDSASALYLPSVGTGGSQSEPEPEPGPTPRPGAPTSEYLIESARQAGKINQETALLYRVYANFHDARLPVEYLGDDSNAAPTLALYQAQAQMAQLSAETQAALAPFLKPPTAADSWLEQQISPAQSVAVAAPNMAGQIQWLTTCQSDSNIKVWYQRRNPEDVDDARTICDLVSVTIWPQLKDLLGRVPLEDVGQANNGGDGRLDIYLVNAKTASLTYKGCFDSPSYILVNNKKWSEAEIVESVMSAFLSSYKAADCLEYMWLFAASRAWSIDYVLRDDNSEQKYADDFLNHTRWSLNSYPIVPLEAENEIGDGAYLWLWYLTKWVGSAKEIMPAIWQNATNPDSLAVVDASAGAGTFAKNWAEFSKHNWNNAPVTDYFMADKLLYSTKPELETDVSLDGNPDRSYELDGNVDYLAAHTYHFTFKGADVRSVLFINPFYDNKSPTAHVDAIYQLADGTWQTEDWTAKYSKEFCRDLTAQRVVDLTVVISNHEFKDRTKKLNPAYPPRLNVTNVGCRGWVFEGSATQTVVAKDINTSETTEINATYLREESEDANGSHPLSLFRVKEGQGSGSWSYTGVAGKCHAKGKDVFELTGGLQTYMLLYDKATDHETGTLYAPVDRSYVGLGSEGLSNFNKLMVTYICPNGQSNKSLVVTGQRWFMTEAVATQKVSEDGNSIEGHYTIVDDPGAGGVRTTTYTWKMTALPPQ